MEISKILPFSFVQSDSISGTLAAEDWETVESQLVSIVTGKNVAVIGDDVDVSANAVKGQVVHGVI